ncbi:phosphoethanolamine--lipid A transferase EptA [Capnocytophaga sp.]|uniref:phosphoethanolamine--lipid A transferase EptA n=1 Tax=Capnocytophaga sp. TaxID=44737 RepID=UPI0026DC4423|nr:phosphoethanolamine--lipid A transferase EptA [Capnocytophaga sp.]MDO5106334.1 phosphoethanolamine--lipid A transferase EptA [Capnocytophaga sp.]
MLKKFIDTISGEVSLLRFVLILSILNFALFHYPFFGFVLENINYKSFNGALLIISLLVLVIVANAFAFYLLVYLSRRIGKVILALLFIISSIAVYFINTYSIIVDESMIGNVLNTNYEESSSFFSWKLVAYVIFLGLLPAIYIVRAKVIKPAFKRFARNMGLTLLFMVLMVVINAGNVLWIDKHSKYLGGLVMPWSYIVNTSLFYVHKHQANREEIRLPDATIKDDEKAVFVLVIGESARMQNFSLYGYPKNTNPLLAQTDNLFHFPASSCATYTTAGVKCILEHENTGDLYEILPNYLHRNDVEVIWRTTNSGEPPVHIAKYQDGSYLREKCQGESCQYDEILLAGLKEEILSSTKPKVLVILHTSTSHGPTYNKKYPPRFEAFTPVCTSVELAQCTQEELINAYDNTIVYTDYLLHQTIEVLRDIPEYRSAMLYVSDHGESLGEKNLYMHGLPMSIAPKEQYEIPFIVWLNDSNKNVKQLTEATQHHVFHSVLNFLSVESPVYKEEMNIFK